MKTLTSIILGITLLVVPSLSRAADTVTPFSQVISGSCILEDIAVVGTITTSVKVTQVGQYLRYDITDRTKGEGTGLSTGVKYQASGKTTTRILLTTEELNSYSYKSGFTLIGPGPDNNLTINYIFRQTVDGVVIDSFSASCK